jgi:hypothetical protein
VGLSTLFPETAAVTLLVMYLLLLAVANTTEAPSVCQAAEVRRQLVVILQLHLLMRNMAVDC